MHATVKGSSGGAIQGEIMSDTQKQQTIDELGEVFQDSVQLLADKMGISLDTYAGVLAREGNRVSIEFRPHDEFPDDDGDGHMVCLKYKDGVCILWVPT
jgi:hypothetical protein